MFPPESLVSPEHFLLITDELASPADFLLHRILSTQLKDPKICKSVVLSVSEDLSRWKAIAAKSNISLTQHPISESFVFVDVLRKAKPPSMNDSANLRPILDIVSTILGERDSRSGVPKSVILEDITSLLWIGFSPLDLVRFARALHALCLKSSASLIIRHHIVSPGEPDDLFRHLLQMCTYHLDVRPLSSGRSGAVSGEVALHAGPSTKDPKIHLVPRSSAVHYRLTDNGCVFFERGTGGGVL